MVQSHNIIYHYVIKVTISFDHIFVSLSFSFPFLFYNNFLGWSYLGIIYWLERKRGKKHVIINYVLVNIGMLF